MSQSVRAFAGQTPQLGTDTYIDPAATVIGDVVLGDHCSVWPQAVIRGDMHSIRIGARTNVQDNAVLHITHGSVFNPDGWPLTIGSDVTIGHSVCLHGCTIGDRVLVGIGAIILDGAVVDNEVVIGAGTLVPPDKHLESGFLYLGSPCKKARPLKEAERLFFTYSAKNYVDLKNQYAAK